METNDESNENIKQEQICDEVQHFIEVYDDVLVKIGIQASMEHGPGVLMVDIEDREAGKINSKYIKIEDIPDHMHGYKERIINNPARDRTIYYTVSYKDNSAIMERQL